MRSWSRAGPTDTVSGAQISVTASEWRQIAEPPVHGKPAVARAHAEPPEGSGNTSTALLGPHIIPTNRVFAARRRHDRRLGRASPRQRREFSINGRAGRGSSGGLVGVAAPIA